MSAKRVTLRDVAAASGVSRATAGFVLSDSPAASISQPTRERVRQAARDLGYVPHGIARALREGSSRIVILAVDWGNDGNYARTFIRGLDGELGTHDHVLLVRHGDAAGDSMQQVLDAVAPRAVLRLAENYLVPGHEFDDGGWDGGLAENSLVQLRYLVTRGHSPSRWRCPTASSRSPRCGCASPRRRRACLTFPRRRRCSCRATVRPPRAPSGSSSRHSTA